MEESRFRHLLELLKADDLSEELWTELLTGIDQGKFDNLLNEDILSTLEHRKKNEHWTLRRQETVLDKIKAKTGLRRKQPMFKRKTWIRYAAASVILTISILGYFLLFNKPSNQISNLKIPLERKDISPGSNKATLTLSNGVKIMLDSATDGLLAEQSGSSAFKSGNGQLNYRSTEYQDSAVVFNTLTTPRGGMYRVSLPDGTDVWLNAASSITYPTHFQGSRREVKISGEVYFEVAHDAAHPFVVTANESKIEVVGTHFNINLYGDDPQDRVTLLEGSVKVSTNTSHILLSPNEQALIHGQDITMDRIPDLEKIMAWKNGEMVLSHGSVARLMRDISRWYDVDIEYRSVIPEGKFSGSIDRNVPLSSILNVLRAYGIETRLEGKKIVVL